MKESSPSVSPNASVSLPRYLSRPDYRDISEDKLVALDAELAGTPLDYIHDGLEAIGPDMIRALSNVKAQPVRNNLPKELSIVVDDMSRYMPTHMLAVYARQSSATRRRVTLFPVHNIILAAHCANLPQLPESNPSAPDVPGSSISVPVVPLCIPAPETFPHLSAFLYTKRVDHLLSSLLPCPAPPSLYREEPMESGNPELVQFATKLSSMYTAQALLSRAMLVNGLWRNVCALGIFDERLWGAMDVAWEVLLTAMAIATGKPQMILGTQSS
ncbi:hypothetical protein SERLA73DRAFT_167356 [Serpula lacrymans var. lacrymans S7.3]|uniref:Uncharacterized protein n=2 Tax=Serpula lacrymans var. lacrymans TaxID=341189 RepID=F8PS53_SERL3|nr:uncharacterized protein SERLADRAFT_464458 [Serpula lacrymans var. lacrymans S7.9]EGO01235.1 hypothetical protein SERLA73DRAFT_167356 [Serpula lacrymans var. lacrymans S7.3]EGO26884.1 hypothetical protein SERLADRAFT_464458 [Serpula lacrymans var. lacrymans S7.9]